MLQCLSLVLGTSIVFGMETQTLQAVEIKPDQYHEQSYINQYLRSVATRNPDIAQFQILGQSLQGREISLLIMGSGNRAAKPAIYINGTHHGNERASTEAVLSVIDFFEKQKEQKDIREILARYSLYLQPVVNPDGLSMNSRFDSAGRDPNRDYSHPYRSDANSFKMPETKLVSNLLKRRRFLAAAAFHSGTEAVFWPWGYKATNARDHRIFKNVGQSMAEAMKIEQFSQSFHDYQTHGEFIDYAYMKYRTFAFTVEVSEEMTPPNQQLSHIRKKSVRGTLAMIFGLEKALEKSVRAH